MTDLIANLGLGFATAFTLQNLLYCFAGCVMGTLVGVLPGIGPSATIAMLLPLTFGLDPTTSLIMLAGIYYGAQYGGSTTAILVNLPGEASSVVTALDGYQLAKQGKAGLALAIAAIGSFVAGSFATLVIAMFAPALALLSLSFGAAEYFSLMVLGLLVSIALSQSSLISSLAMLLLGILVGTVGIDVNSSVYRLTFGMPELFDGVSLVAVAMGLFGVGEIISNLADGGIARQKIATPSLVVLPTRQEARQATGPILRGTLLGTVLGVLPGGGALLSSFASYALEKRLSAQPERFGKGALEGVAGPESANNAGAQTSFIPMLTLGIPSNVVMALMVGAMIIQGIQPGPSVIREQPSLFWGLIVSMWIGNLMLLILNLPLVGLWARLMLVPYRLLYPMILVLCYIGVFTISNSVFDLYILTVFGILGYVFRKMDCDPAPFILALVLGPMIEEYFRRAMLLSRGDPLIFLERPISAALLAFSLICVLTAALPRLRKLRETALIED